ncbi:hypothetical protein ACI65C_004147 [Semiaphis heraclei]
MAALSEGGVPAVVLTIENTRLKENSRILPFHARDTKRNKCERLRKVQRQCGNLISHRRSHTGERPYQCDICRKAYTSSTSLKKHQKLHTDIKTYSCYGCNISFSTKRELEEHRLKHHQELHTNLILYSCNECNISFSTKRELEEHRWKHLPKRPYPCNTCDKSYITKYGLVKHQRVHTGERPFRCDICEMSFIAREYMEVHRRTHTGEKPFNCAICNKSFGNRSNMNRHMVTHKDSQMLYPLDVCEVLFSRDEAAEELAETPVEEIVFKSLNVDSSSKLEIVSEAVTWPKLVDYIFLSFQLSTISIDYLLRGTVDTNNTYFKIKFSKKYSTYYKHLETVRYI